MTTKQLGGLAVGLLMLGVAAAQTVHKWVDEQGRVHYGSQPPASAQTETIKGLPNGDGAGAGAPRRVINEVRAKERLQELAKIQTGAPLSCEKAGARLHSQMDTMLEVSQKNFRDGFVTAADYEPKAAKIRETKTKVSVSDCESAVGVKKDFYTCMSHSSNHLFGCALKHRY